METRFSEPFVMVALANHWLGARPGVDVRMSIDGAQVQHCPSFQALLAQAGFRRIAPGKSRGKYAQLVCGTYEHPKGRLEIDARPGQGDLVAGRESDQWFAEAKSLKGIDGRNHHPALREALGQLLTHAPLSAGKWIAAIPHTDAAKNYVEVQLVGRAPLKAHPLEVAFVHADGSVETVGLGGESTAPDGR